MIKATVRCSDGKCYPCQFIDWMTDYDNLLPMAFIRFDDDHPRGVNKIDGDYVMVINMIHLNFGGQDEMQEGKEAIARLGR